MFKELDYKSKVEVMKKYAKTNKGKGLSSTLDRLLIEAVILFVSSILIAHLHSPNSKIPFFIFTDVTLPIIGKNISLFATQNI